jgi:hypothetical protein
MFRNGSWVATVFVGRRCTEAVHTSLQLTDEEVDEVYAAFCHKSNMDATMWQHLKDFIVSRSERLPGLFMLMLDKIKELKPHMNPETLSDRIAEYLLTNIFLHGLQGVRGFLR